MSNICNPVALAEVVGREFIEAQLPTKDSYKTNSIIDEIRLINQDIGGIDSSIQRVKNLHGPYRGPSQEIIAFSKNLFGADQGFRESILQIENTVIGITNLINSVGNIGQLVQDVDFQDVSTALLRSYLDNVRILLPESVTNNLTNELNRIPLFAQMSESLGSIYSNIIIPDNSVNMVDGIIGNVLDQTGLSNVLGQHSWIRMLPEYALNFHDNTRLLQRLGSRVLPKCSYGKIYHKMDEALAHIYNLAQDTLGFFDILDNRKNYLNLIFQQYGDLVRKINNLYPICHEYTVENESSLISIGNEATNVDILGNKIQKTSNTRENNVKPSIIS